MRFPWHRRADEERRLRLAAERRFAAAEANWPAVHRQVDELRRHRELNGWTQIVNDLFADQKGFKP